MSIKNVGLAMGALVLGTTVGMATLQTVSAAEGPKNTLISNLAQKFNAPEDDVKGVFTATHEQMKTEMKKEQEDALTQAVKDGKITEDQKKTLLEKWANIDAKMAEVQKAHEDLEKWADDNKIDLAAIMPFRGIRGGHFHHGH